MGRSGIQTASRHFLELTLEVLRLREVEFQDPEPSFLLDGGFGSPRGSLTDFTCFENK